MLLQRDREIQRERERERHRDRCENCIDFRVANNGVVAAAAANSSFDAVATATETMPAGAQHSWHSFREQFRCQEAWGVQCSEEEGIRKLGLALRLIEPL